MKEKELKNLLRKPFRLDEEKYFPLHWKEIFKLVFKKTDYFSNAEQLFTENGKVINGKQLGTVKLDDGKQLAIFTIEVADNVFINRNRQELREIASKYIDQNIIHGALAFFYSKAQIDYRFSFIAKEASINLETGELIKGETKPKRFTFLLGTNEACTTPAKHILVLADKNEKGIVDIKQLKEVFSVETLNKDFFKTYKAHYDKFWKYLAEDASPYRSKLIDITKEDKVKQEKPIRDFAKKLLGRIVFLHFLQKKGWMGCSVDNIDWVDGKPRFMQQLFVDFTKPDYFLSKCLNKLFFDTLNNKRTKDIFAIEGLNGELNGSRVPYLNGGLFEQETNKQTLKIDFPSDYFKELLEFFEQYNFTIDENSPDDQEVGIDPEMLGHIFENLLEDNRDKGAFYTPKEIVQFMCKESLIQYLLNTFTEKEDIEAFIRLHSVSPYLAKKENAALLNQKLDDIKVCDPAIGSGAFPIGILQEIFEAKRFIYPYLKTNADFKPADVKKNIIQSSIYGVDIDKGAVDIAQLRFWLSLVVDELNPHPLPNLDYKIMQGNSLLEKFKGIDFSQISSVKCNIPVAEPTRDLFGNLTEGQMKLTFAKSETISQIQKLIKIFFTVEISAEKHSIRNQINSLVIHHIEYNIELRENQLKRFIAELGKSKNFNKNAQKKYDGYIIDIEHIQETKSELLIIQETDERPYFLWHLYFMDVFEKGGFDVIIGNPPYIQLQKMGNETDILQDAGFESFVRTGDIYCLFYEKGIKLLKKEEGILSYITSNSWMKAKYGTSLRKFFKDFSNPLFLLNFEDTQLFPSATVETNILILRKNTFEGKLEAVAIKSDIGKTSLTDYQLKNHIVIKKLEDEGWNVLSTSDNKIKLAVELKGSILKESYHINRGILTGFNEAFVITKDKRDELLRNDIKNDLIIKRFISGRDLSKYRVGWKDTWLIASHNGVKQLGIPAINVLQDFPFVYEHLQSYKSQLVKRTDQGNHWSNLRDCSYILDFDKPKLVWAELSDLAKFVYDDEGYYTNKTAFILTGKNLKYLMILLNSRLLVWYFSQISTSSGMGTTIWNKYKVEQIPIILCNEEINSKFEIISNIILYLNHPQTTEISTGISNEHISNRIEDLANMMVYELYFADEVKAKEIDVLQFVTEQTFPDITKTIDKKTVIQKIYYELQQKDNSIRNRILVASSRSETIARINAATN